MNGVAYHSRRASADDLTRLIPLWRAGGFDCSELEKRFTEFQLVEDASGQIAGAIGLRVGQQQGLLHSETYLDFGLVDTLRSILWQRVKNVAGSYGLFRLWTTETAPFWRQEDFAPAADDVLARFPEEFGPKESRWLTLKLRNELALDEFLVKELAAFKKTEREHNEQLLHQARIMKGVATLIAVGALVLSAYFIYHLFARNIPSAP